MSDAALATDEAGHVILKPRQQLLEEAPEAFFTPKEAVDMLERADRSIFVLAQCVAPTRLSSVAARGCVATLSGT